MKTIAPSRLLILSMVMPLFPLTAASQTIVPGDDKAFCAAVEEGVTATLIKTKEQAAKAPEILPIK